MTELFIFVEFVEWGREVNAKSDVFVFFHNNLIIKVLLGSATK